MTCLICENYIIKRDSMYCNEHLEKFGANLPWDFVYLGHLSTTNFDFYAVANTEQELINQMAKAWEEHRTKTGASLLWDDVSEDLFYKAMPVNSTHKR